MNLNYSREICDNLQQHEEEQVEVQKYVSSLQAYNSMIQVSPNLICHSELELRIFSEIVGVTFN